MNNRKTLLVGLGAVAMAIITPVKGQNFAEEKAFCESMQNLATQIMTNRQMGMPRAHMDPIVNDFDPQTKAQARTMLDQAYDIRQHPQGQRREDSVESFGYVWREACHRVHID